LRTSRKKRRYGSERARSGKRRQKASHRDYDGDSSFEKSRLQDADEVEAGEIDDVCEEEFAVEKEFEDLLSYNKGSGGGMAVGNVGSSGQAFQRHGNPSVQQQQMLLQQQQLMMQQQQQVYQQGHNTMNYNGGNMGGLIGSNSYQGYNQQYGNQQGNMMHKNVGHQGGKSNNASGIY